VFVLFLAVFLVVLIASQWNRWIGSAAEQTTDDAYIQADITALAAKSPGYVRSVPVQDFQRVKAGDLLVEVVDDDYRAELSQADANVVSAKTAIDNIEQQTLSQKALVKQSEATIRVTEADLTRYRLERVRQQNLVAVSRSKSLYFGKPQIQRDEAIRTATFGASGLIHAAQALGYGTTPMIGFDPAGVSREFNLGENEVPALLVAVGYATPENWPQKPRRPVADILDLV
jgi:multidrug resistance efflux pump